MAQAIVVFKDLFQGIRNLLKKERGTAKPKRKVKVYAIMRLPVYTHKVPVFRVDGHQVKGRFQVHFGHKTPSTQGPQYHDRVIDTNVLQRIRILWYVVIDTIPFRVREMINGTPFYRVLFRDYAYRVTLQVR